MTNQLNSLCALLMLMGDDKSVGKGRLVLFGILVAIFCLLAWMYNLNVSCKLNAEEKTEVISLVNSYYDRMKGKDYKEALELVDLTKSDYDKSMETISNKKGYEIEQRLEGNYWVIPMNGKHDYIAYNKENRCFIVEIGANIINNSDTYEATENVYVKRIGKYFKIVKITTDDRFGYMRGSFVKR